jgi:hypothetical protein
MKHRMIRFIVAGSLLAGMFATGTAAMAKGTDVIRRGACSGASDWKLKLSPDNGKIEVEYQVDSNKVGQTWHVKLFHDGNRIFAGTRQTQAPSGSFEVRVRANNTAGTDSFRGRATNAATGEVCGGSASIG